MHKLSFQTDRHRQPASPAPQAPVKPGRYTLADITVVMAAFRRPELVVATIQSIRERYPALPVIVADNGDDPPDLSFDGGLSRLIQLPFDAGVCVSRNAAIQAVQTPLVFMTDDDHLFTEHSQIELLLSVLNSDSSIGIVGGWLDEHWRGVRSAWHLQFQQQGRGLNAHVARSPVAVTGDGVPHWQTDTCLNFALARREVYADNPWREELKICEHWDFFWRLRQQGKWRVAFCPWFGGDHLPRVESDDYKSYRYRHRQFNELSRTLNGFAWVDDFPWQAANGTPAGRPNLIVLTPGHTGSSVVTAMLGELGWNLPRDSNHYAESPTVERLNQAQSFDVSAAKAFLQGLPQPWVLKDPRFSERLLDWLPALVDYSPTLVSLTRDAADVVESYRRRGEAAGKAERRLADCERLYDLYPWPRIALSFEQVEQAATLFQAGRIGAGRDGFTELCGGQT